MSVANSIHTVYGYLGQYFDKAYKVDTNGNMTANTTGVLSPYGDFFPTEPGQAALVTMPDIDSGARGTCAVYSVSVQLDSNHDGNMDLSFNGADFTSANNPVQIWVNDNYDRGHIVDGNDFEQDDLGPVDVATGYLVPDYQYMTNGLHAIPCTRDLEDYFRLWTPGLSAAMSAMPAGYTAQFTLSGDGQIRIFRAVEANGGTNYLFDETTASNQVANSGSLHVGLLTASTPVTLNNTNEHYIFCGVKRGSAQIDLQILDASQNVIADFPAYLQIKSIKEMYERWTVGDMPNNAPTSVAVKDASDLPMNPPVPAFAYSASQNTNTPYILFVHGWNMERWEKDRYAETAFKRLYWQGYHGRFGSFRWPTHYDFSLTGINNPINDPKNFDNSESNAWASAVGLLNKLNDLNNQYPGQVYLMAHSMGNVVAGEALRLAGNNHVVNTYVAMQGAIASHAYDSTTTTRSLGIQDSATPNRYAQYWTNGAPCYFNNSVGAGIYVNFYNTNDYALNSQNWQLDQNLKPDIGYTYDAYNGGFFRGTIVLDPLNFPANTYELFAYCIEARCYAIGAQANVGGSFTTARQVNLSGSPYNFANTHKYHSGEFRSDNMSRTLFWNAVLTQMRLN
jgi:pimeloyl-ACP methyl ester carboxylesterase